MSYLFFFTKFLYVLFFQEKRNYILASSRELSIPVYLKSSNNGIDNRVAVLHNHKYTYIQSFIKREQHQMHENNQKMNVLKQLLYKTNLHEKINIINQNHDIFPSTISHPFVSSPNLMANLNNNDFNFTNNEKQIFVNEDFYKLYILLD